MRFSQAVTASLLARAFLAVLAFGSSALAARILSPADFGAVVTTLAAIALVMRVMSLGIGQSAQYFGAVERGGGRSRRGALLIFGAVLTLAAVLAMPLFTGPLATVLGGDSAETRHMFGLLQFGIPLSLIGFFASLYYLGQRKFGLYYLAMGGPTVVLAAGLGWVLLTGGGPAEVGGVYLAQFIMMALLALPMLAPLARPGSLRALTADLREIGRYAVKSYLIFVVAFAVTRLSIFLGVQLTTLEAVGFFAVARTLGEATFQFYGAIGPVLLSYIGASKDTRGSATLLALVSRLSSTLYCALAAATIVGAWWLLGPIFGEAYVGALIPLCVLLPGVVLNGLQHTFESYLYATDRQGPVVAAHLAGAVALVCSALAFAPGLGATGLAIAATSYSIVAFGVTAFLLWRQTGLTPLDTLVPRPEDVKLAIGAGRRLLKR